MWLAERLGSGDGEREASMTRQMPFEPLPASVLFGLALAVTMLMNHFWGSDLLAGGMIFSALSFSKILSFRSLNPRVSPKSSCFHP